MADQKLTDKGNLSSFDDADLIHVVDVSDTTSSPEGTSKKGFWSLVKSTLKTYFDGIYTEGTSYDTVAAMVSASPSAGSIVTTLGYTAANDGGGNIYRIVDDATLTQDYGAIINITGNIYAVAVDTSNLTNKHYGIFSDSSTDWASTNFNQFNGMINASVLYGITIISEEGTYFNVSLNLDDSHSGAKIHFDNAVFSNLIHVVGTDISNQIEGMVLTGHVTTYDRYGTTFAKNIVGGLNITCKSDIAIHPTGSVGRGVHIYHTTQNHHYGSIIIEYAGASGSNVQAAFALDGFQTSTTQLAPEGHFIESVWVQDTDVRGAQITGIGHQIGLIRVDKYGSSSFSNNNGLIGGTSYNSENTDEIAQGVLLASTDCNVKQIIVDQADGFTGRSRALTDVAIGRALTESTPTVALNTTPTIGSVICRNPQRQAVSVGAYQLESGAIIGSVQINIVDDDNIMELDASGERAIYGLIDCYYGSIDIGRIFVENPKNVTMLMQRDVYSTGTERQRVGLNVDILHTPVVDVATTKYNIFQGVIGYIIAWNDTNNLKSYATFSTPIAQLENNLDFNGYKATDFQSTGIDDQTTATTLTLTDNNASQFQLTRAASVVALRARNTQAGGQAKLRLRNNEAYWEFINDGSGNFIFGQSDSFFPVFIQKDTPSNTIKTSDSGYLGVGKTPTEKLDVDGKIKAIDCNFSGLPTSSTGLSSGDLWNDSGTLKIV